MRNLLFVLVVASAVALVGCKKDDAPPTTNTATGTTQSMKTPGVDATPDATASPMASPSAAAAGDNAKFVGVWKMQADSIKLSSTKPEDQAKIGPQTEEAKKKMGNATIEFKADGTFALTSPGEPGESGTYSVANNVATLVSKTGGTPPKVTLSADGAKISFHFDEGGRSMDFDAAK